MIFGEMINREREEKRIPLLSIELADKRREKGKENFSGEKPQGERSVVRQRGVARAMRELFSLTAHV